jgi:hypothetical protein
MHWTILSTLLLTVANNQAAAPAMDSAYTPLNLDACEMLEAIPEGESARCRCPGFAGVPLFVNAGDGRFDVDAGVDNDNHETLPNFNDIGDRVEWRHEGGRPFAIIYRLRNADPERPAASTLIVGTIGRAGAPGCEVARVDGSLPDANARARAIADTQARTHRCGR